MRWASLVSDPIATILLRIQFRLDHLPPECSLRHLSLVLLNYPCLADHWGAFGVEEQEGIRVLLEL